MSMVRRLSAKTHAASFRAVLNIDISIPFPFEVGCIDVETKVNPLRSIACLRKLYDIQPAKLILLLRLKTDRPGACNPIRKYPRSFVLNCLFCHRTDSVEERSSSAIMVRYFYILMHRQISLLRLKWNWRC